MSTIAFERINDARPSPSAQRLAIARAARVHAKSNDTAEAATASAEVNKPGSILAVVDDGIMKCEHGRTHRRGRHRARRDVTRLIKNN